MKDLSRRKFLTGAAVAVPAAAVVVALPQVVAAAPEVPMEYAHGFTMDAAWPGAEIIVPDRVTVSSAPVGNPPTKVNMKLDFKAQTISLYSPCTGLSLFLAIKTMWRDTDAIRYPFPMMAITPEMFTMEEGWKLNGIVNLQNASLKDDGYGNRVLGCISLGQVFEDEMLAWAPGWAPGGLLARTHTQPFSKTGHVNEGIVFPSTAETIYIKCGGEAKDMGEMCGFGDMSHHAQQPIKFPLWQQNTI